MLKKVPESQSSCVFLVAFQTEYMAMEIEGSYAATCTLPSFPLAFSRPSDTWVSLLLPLLLQGIAHLGQHEQAREEGVVPLLE